MGRIPWSRAKVPLNVKVKKSTLDLLKKLARIYESDVDTLIDEAVCEYYEDERK